MKVQQVSPHRIRKTLSRIHKTVRADLYFFLNHFILAWVIMDILLTIKLWPGQNDQFPGNTFKFI